MAPRYYGTTALWYYVTTELRHQEYQWVPVDTSGYQWVPVGTGGYQWVPVGTSGNQWLPVGTIGYQWEPKGASGYQEYQEDQDQISGATYISDVVLFTK